MYTVNIPLLHDFRHGQIQASKPVWLKKSSLPVFEFFGKKSLQKYWNNFSIAITVIEIPASIKKQPKFINAVYIKRPVPCNKNAYPTQKIYFIKQINISCLIKIFPPLLKQIPGTATLLQYTNLWGSIGYKVCWKQFFFHNNCISILFLYNSSNIKNKFDVASIFVQHENYA